MIFKTIETNTVWKFIITAASSAFYFRNLCISTFQVERKYVLQDALFSLFSFSLLFAKLISMEEKN